MTTREQVIDRFVLKISRAEATGRKLPGGRRHYDARCREFAGHLFDGEAKGLSGKRLFRYARKKTCGLNPLLWFQLASLMVSLFRLWQEWRTNERWGEVDNQGGS